MTLAAALSQSGDIRKIDISLLTLEFQISAPEPDALLHKLPTNYLNVTPHLCISSSDRPIPHPF
ncbi:hypothetical protein [Hyphomicrobium sp.]|uniref:hypothetical protein n=1 Tax=Hyphomicrobium sp. TaxID=82 RepID=UPI0025C18BEF|nr:hypothetical protein [Hyphomicrobium sp.]